jgi:hypothetical protein
MPPPGVTDPVPGNNTATDNNQIAPSADIGDETRDPSLYIAGSRSVRDRCPERRPV